MNPLVGLFLFGLCLTVLSGSARSALLALFAGALFVSQYQEIHLLSLHLFSTRVLEIALFIRVVSRGGWSNFKLNEIDRAVLLFYAYTTIVFLIRSPDGQLFQVGVAVDAFLVYFCARTLIESPEDFRWLIRAFVLILIPYALIVTVEHLTGHSPLAFVGWGSSGAWMRDGGVRSFASFRHPSLLGTIGVGFIPILIGMGLWREDRRRAALGIFVCLIIVWTANSGGPLSGVAFGCVAWACWILRKKMRMVRWSIVAFLAVADVLMKAPIWYLVAHVSSVTGGDGWHRAFLMNVSFENIGKWWLAGMPEADTADWFPYINVATHGADLTNEFISFGLTAGLGSMALFILILVRAFRALGKALEAVRAASPHPGEAEFFLWGLGSMLAAHIINWLGITYFDQTYVFWYTQLAAIATLSDWYIKNASEGVAELQDEEVGSEIQTRPITAQ